MKEKERERERKKGEREGKREEGRKKSPQCFSQVFENMVFSVAGIRWEKENYLNGIDKLNGDV